jgi:hypothetical protein
MSEELVPIELPSLLNLEAEDTMREFLQILKLEFVEVEGKWFIQICVDRRHKLDKKLSKPAAYLRLTEEKLESLAVMAYASYLVLTMKNLEAGIAIKVPIELVAEQMMIRKKLQERIGEFYESTGYKARNILGELKKIEDVKEYENKTKDKTQ